MQRTLIDLSLRHEGDIELDARLDIRDLQRVRIGVVVLGGVGEVASRVGEADLADVCVQGGEVEGEGEAGGAGFVGEGEVQEEGGREGREDC